MRRGTADPMTATRRSIMGLALVSTSLACSEPSEGIDRRCRDSDGGLAYAGCSVLRGQVLNSAGQPLRDIHVHFEALRPCGCTEFGADADPQGRFVYTINRLDPDPTGDTLTVRVHAAATGEQYPQPTPGEFVRDSLDAVVTFSEVGVVPDTTTVEIRLAVP
ncbi:MAG TPA: hypothetical protein VFH26_09940 [Gemmatimonadales bacterium]|nr:hypothetical protein [Gemmatimonadales bacterium]